MADLEFFIDPVCPFCWITSRWVEEVRTHREVEVRWRFIALRLLNEHRDYAAEFPEGYVDGHGAGLRTLRVLHAVRDEHGNDAVGRLYRELGVRIHDEGGAKRFRDEDMPTVVRELLGESLRDADLPLALAETADDEGRDDALRDEKELALSRAGADVGTPILTFAPGTAEERGFFGPVISSIPRGAAAVRLWELVSELAGFPAFAELKRSLRDRPRFD